MDASTGGRTSQTRSWFCKHQHDLAAWHALIESEMLRLPACVENAQRKGRGLPGRHVLHQNSEIDFVQHKVLLHNGPPKSFFQDEECESCNEMLQHQILALYLSKMLLSRLLIDSGNTWQSSDWPDAASSPPCSSSSKDINVSSTSISAWSFVSVLATTKTPPKVPGLMLLQNHLHTWDLKCIVLSTIKVLVCNHVKPLFIVHCHLSAAAMHCYAEFDHETSRWSKARFFLVRWNNAGESSPFGKKLKKIDIWPLGICRVGRSQRSMWADRNGRTPGQAGLWGWCACGLSFYCSRRWIQKENHTRMQETSILSLQIQYPNAEELIYIYRY